MGMISKLLWELSPSAGKRCLRNLPSQCSAAHPGPDLPFPSRILSRVPSPGSWTLRGPQGFLWHVSSLLTVTPIACSSNHPKGDLSDSRDRCPCNTNGLPLSGPKTLGPKLHMGTRLKALFCGAKEPNVAHGVSLEGVGGKGWELHSPALADSLCGDYLQRSGRFQSKVTSNALAESK